MSWAVWITGLPGSGKSSVARAAAADLAARGEAVEVLELDALRRALTPVATYDDAEREAVYRSLVTIAAVLTRAGCPVIIDATGHKREWRDLARATIGEFAEVQLECPLDVARERERTRGPGHHPRAIYARAGRPGATVPGVDVAYEPALAPELIIDTATEPVESAGARVAALARGLVRRAARPARTEGWAVWLSGRPGSGKTTLASALCERLTARGVAVVVLDPDEFVLAVAPGGALSLREGDVVTRAIVETARRLSVAGIAVIVDGPAPRRDAGCLAREVIADFAQVELACAPDVCRTRERAVRWNLVPCPGAQRPVAAPALGLAYESAVAPDLTLYTDVLDERMATEEIWRLVECLRRAAQERSRSCA
jgi:adenylylsulfate kinase